MDQGGFFKGWPFEAVVRVAFFLFVRSYHSCPFQSSSAFLRVVVALGEDHGLLSRLSSSLAPMDIAGRSLEGYRRSSRHHRDS